MTLVNHLRDLEAQNLFHAVAYGKHLVTGNLAKSIVTGSDPTHQITLQQMLGRGPWDACEGLWWSGVQIPTADYKFFPGTQSSGMGDSTQGQDTIFDTDTPHSGVAWIRAALPTGMGDFDTKNNPPYGLKGIFRTMKIQDYNSSGVEQGLSYSPNPAREVADLIIRIGGRPSSRIDWGAWVDWRDFCLANISFDYTAITGLPGFGLTAQYYNGTSFDTLVTERIDPVVEFVSSAGSPAIGVDTDNFSARWEGKIKPLYSENYTFTITHTHGVKLWVNGNLVIDQWSASGTHSSSGISLSNGSFYDIKVEWKHTTGNADIALKWQSSSQDLEVIPHRVLYPKTVSRPRYETHPFWSGPTRLDDAVRTILNLCNSTVQEVNGKLRFLCLEQLTTHSYHFTDDHIVENSVKLIPRDPLTIRNSWQARFRDVDSQYLEYPIDPILIERPDLITLAGRQIDGESIEMFNCTMHQGYRMLDNWVKRNVDSKYTIELTGMPESYQVLAGDRVKVDVEFLDWTDKPMLVMTSNDSSSEETAEERPIVMQEWTL